MNEPETIKWQAPRFETSPRVRFDWVEDMIAEGEGWLENQQCYKDLARNLRVFDAIFSDKTKSSLVTNELKYDIRKFCETLAEVREIAGYGSDNPSFKAIAETLTKVSKCVYLESDFPFQILKVLQYASVMGIGYLWPKVAPKNMAYGERRLCFDALGLLDVVPVQIPPRSNDVQDAYAVTVYDYMPIAEAHGRFPLFQNRFRRSARAITAPVCKRGVSIGMRSVVMATRAGASANSTPRYATRSFVICESTTPDMNCRWVILAPHGSIKFPSLGSKSSQG